MPDTAVCFINICAFFVQLLGNGSNIGRLENQLEVQLIIQYYILNLSGRTISIFGPIKFAFHVLAAIPYATLLHIYLLVLTLAEPTQHKPVQDPLAVQHLENQLYMSLSYYLLIAFPYI